MKLLLHACCGPCACYPLERLRAEGIEPAVLYYNPNIHPYQEFKRRLAALRELCAKWQTDLYIDKRYELELCLRGMLAEPGLRCAFCYRMRLEYTAQFAKEQGFDAFSSTLLVSIYQKHELIKRIAEETAEKFAIPFYYEDFRSGYERGKELSLELGLYRQPYCGCIFSERDRFEMLRKNSPEDGGVTRVSRHLSMINRTYSVPRLS